MKWLCRSKWKASGVKKRTTKLRLYDVVELKQELSGTDFPIGTQGTVVMVFTDPSFAVLIEFVDSDGQMLDVCLLTDDAIAETVDLCWREPGECCDL